MRIHVTFVGRFTLNGVGYGMGFDASDRRVEFTRDWSDLHWVQENLGAFGAPVTIEVETRELLAVDGRLLRKLADPEASEREALAYQACPTRSSQLVWATLGEERWYGYRP